MSLYSTHIRLGAGQQISFSPLPLMTFCFSCWCKHIFSYFSNAALLRGDASPRRRPSLFSEKVLDAWAPLILAAAVNIEKMVHQWKTAVPFLVPEMMASYYSNSDCRTDRALVNDRNLGYHRLDHNTDCTKCNHCCCHSLHP